MKDVPPVEPGEGPPEVPHWAPVQPRYVGEPDRKRQADAFLAGMVLPLVACIFAAVIVWLFLPRTDPFSPLFEHFLSSLGQLLLGLFLAGMNATAGQRPQARGALAGTGLALLINFGLCGLGPGPA